MYVKVHYVRMMWYVHKRRTTVFDGEPSSRSCRNATTSDQIQELFFIFSPYFCIFQPNLHLAKTEELEKELAKRKVTSTKVLALLVQKYLLY